MSLWLGRFKVVALNNEQTVVLKVFFILKVGYPVTIKHTHEYR